MIDRNTTINSNKLLFLEPQLGRPSAVTDISKTTIAKCNKVKCYISPHFYVPGDITHAGVYNIPATKCYTSVSKKVMLNSLNTLRADQVNRKYRMFIGEFATTYMSGRVSGCNNQYLWTRDVLYYFKDKGWQWSYHDASLGGNVWTPWLNHNSTISEYTLTAQLLKRYAK